MCATVDTQCLQYLGYITLNENSPSEMLLFILKLYRNRIRIVYTSLFFKCKTKSCNYLQNKIKNIGINAMENQICTVKSRILTCLFRDSSITSSKRWVGGPKNVKNMMT